MQRRKPAAQLSAELRIFRRRGGCPPSHPAQGEAMARLSLEPQVSQEMEMIFQRRWTRSNRLGVNFNQHGTFITRDLSCSSCQTRAAARPPSYHMAGVFIRPNVRGTLVTIEKGR